MIKQSQAMDGEVRQLKWSDLTTRSGLTTCWEGASDPIISAVAEDSRQVSPGTCFVAVRGANVDGHDFIESAIRKGAAAIVCEARPRTDLPLLHVQNTRGVTGRLAAVLYGLDQMQQAGRLKLAAVTGTNGKSTFCYLLRSILAEANHPTAMLGTIQYDLLSRKIEASMTTPPAASLISYVAEAVRAGATHAVMEVSSHALDQERCAGLQFAVGVFTNLTGDHLDYHENMDSYLLAKKHLFDGLGTDATAVVNADDPACDRMIADCPSRVWRYSLSPGQGDLTARIEDVSAHGTRFELTVEKQSIEIDSPLIGRHNVQNSLAAGGAALALDIPLETVAAGLRSMRQVPGRLQRVTPDGWDFTVLVDYAHTDDALKNVLSALQPLAKRRLIVLFGCGGDRDRSKRPRMASVAARWADHIVVTNDNPRMEDPQQIIDDILMGFEATQRRKVHIQPDRRTAVADAIAMAETGDIVLLAGKGHENYQIIGQEKVEFDDATVAAELLAS